MKKTYTTRQGDMWDIISYRLTGSNDQVIPLMQANPEYTETYIFPAGVVLNVPDLNNIMSTYTLPPWERIS